MRDNLSLVFLHIPRTGGNTLTRALRRRMHFASSRPVVGLVRDPEEDLRSLEAAREGEDGRKPSLVYGHFAFGVDALLGGDCRYVVFLREPVARVVSCYRHAVDLSHRPGLADLPDLGLQGFVESDRVFPPYWVDNGQVRALCGVKGRYPEVPSGGMGAAHLERAKEVLADRVSVLGLTERYDESVLMIRRACQWTLPLLYPVSNASHHRLKTELDAETEQRIRERNELDVELYRWATELFDKRLGEEGKGLAAALRRQRAINRALGPITTAIDRAAASGLRRLRARRPATPGSRSAP